MNVSLFPTQPIAGGRMASSPPAARATNQAAGLSIIKPVRTAVHDLVALIPGHMLESHDAGVRAAPGQPRLQDFRLDTGWCRHGKWAWKHDLPETPRFSVVVPRVVS